MIDLPVPPEQYMGLKYHQNPLIDHKYIPLQFAKQWMAKIDK